MKLSVIGTGYVGLVTGACFAEMGNDVMCIDVDAAKIERLKRGIIPIYEPGLEALVRNNTAQKRLQFSTALDDAVAFADIHFIAVGTPPNEDGSADLQHVLNVARELGRRIERYSIVVDKSTVPVGTAERVRDAIRAELRTRGAAVEFDVVSNPEFLKEGDAVADFMRPDRVIVGCESQRARDTLHQLYGPFMRNHERILFMGLRDAEMTKYAANAMLATKISFMNEIANLCDRLGVDAEHVRVGIGSDQRIGYSFIYPGAGYGGSCFPKDVKALIHMAKASGFEPEVLAAVEARNATQKRVLFDKIAGHFGNALRGSTIALWGLAFKPGTDDMREAPSLTLIEALIGAGARIRAYDPVAMDTARAAMPAAWLERLTFADNQYDAVNGADALALVTEWKPFRYPDFDLLRRRLKQPVIFDGRNQYDPRALAAAGFQYYGIGRRG